MISPKKFRIREDGTNAEGYPAGTICFDCIKHDYGLASDDTRMTGIEHVSVTLDPSGDWPSFTIRRSSLEEVKP
jgi:hypothetical protein